MKPSARNISTTVATACLCAVSFTAGWFLKPAAGEPSPSALDDPARSPAIPAESSARLETRTESRTPDVGDSPEARTELRTAPVDLLTKFWPPMPVDHSAGKFEVSGFRQYGLTAERAKALQESMNAKLMELRGLELSHSRLVTDAEGNQYFQLLMFEEEGEKLKQNVIGIVREAFADFDDNRGWLAALAVTKAFVFAGFGRQSAEIAVEDAAQADGTNKPVLRTKLNTKGSRITDEITSYLDSGSYYSQKYYDLVKHHLQQ